MGLVLLKDKGKTAPVNGAVFLCVLCGKNYAMIKPASRKITAVIASVIRR